MGPRGLYAENLFRKLRLHDGYEAFRELMMDPSSSDKPFDERVIFILERQLQGRSARKFEMLYKKSGIDDKMPGLDRVDFSAGRGLAKSKLADICQCNWVLNENPSWLAICGATGTGKTFLAKTILVAALKLEIAGLFKTTGQLIEELEEARRDGSLAKYRKSLAKCPLIVLDDFVLKGAGEKVLEDISGILDSRYRRKSIIFTSQYPIDEWYGQMGGDGNRSDALMDRIVNCTHVIDLKGGSMRERNKPADLFGKEAK